MLNDWATPPRRDYILPVLKSIQQLNNNRYDIKNVGTRNYGKTADWKGGMKAGKLRPLYQVRSKMDGCLLLENSSPQVVLTWLSQMQEM